MVLSEELFKGFIHQKVLLLTVGVLCFVLPCAAQGIPTRSLAEKDLAFESGEVLRFTIHYDWGLISTDVGTGVARLGKPKDDLFHCEVTGQTTKFWDRIFPVREKFTSTFSSNGLQPRKFTRDTKEGKYVATNTYTYMWDADTAHIAADIYSSHSGHRTLNIPLDKYTYDLPALFYYARNMDFEAVTPGVKHPMTFAIDDDVCHVYFILIGRETKKVKGLGTFKTIKFAAKLVAGEVFTGEKDMYIWVTDDGNRVPVYFEAPIWVGTVSGRLTEATGLKYSF